MSVIPMSVTWSRTRAISRIELRRRWRAIKANPTQLLSLAVVSLFFLPMAVGIPAGAYFGGNYLVSGELTSPLFRLRQISVTLWLAAAAFGGLRGYATVLDPDRRDGLLTTISHQQLIAGLLLTEAIIYGVPASLVVAAAAVLFAVAVGSLLAAPAVFVSVGLLVSTGFLTGIGVALLLKTGGARSRLLRRFRTAAGVAVFIAYMSVFLTGSVGAVLDPLYVLFTPTPLGWLGDLALVSAGIEASALRGGSALVVGIVGLGVSLPVINRLLPWFWYADGPEIEQSTGSSTGDSRLSGLLPQPMAGVVTVDWRRARCAPISLSYTIYPLFLLMTPLIQTIETGTVGTGFVLLVAFCGIWITGGLFTLNIVGNEGAVLPSTLLAPSPGRAVVGGHILAGALVGLPITAAAVVVVGFLSPLSTMAVLSLTLGSLLVGTAAAAIATGIGAALPRYEAVSVSRSRKAIVPSTLAFIGYSLLIGLVSLPLLVGHSRLVGQWISSTLGIPSVAVGVGGLVVTVILAAAFSLVSALYARRRVDRFQFD
jgi:hypothetical protein